VDLVTTTTSTPKILLRDTVGQPSGNHLLRWLILGGIAVVVLFAFVGARALKRRET
jgi:hypothetical protein